MTMQSNISTIEKLNNIAVGLQEHTDAVQLSVFLVETLFTLVPADKICVYFVNPVSGLIELQAAKGFTEQERVSAENTAMEGFTGRVFRTNEVIHINDIGEMHDKEEYAGVADMAVRSCVFLPVIKSAQCVGVLGLMSSSIEAFTGEHIALLSFIANLSGSVYKNILHIQQINAAEEIMRLHDRALMSSSNGIVITDALQEDNPVIYVNNSFEKLTGYTKEDAVGKNCRFLNSPETDRAALKKIRDAIKECREASVVFINRRKDGSHFWNELTITPLVNEEGVTTHFIGVQEDVTQKIIAGDELRNASIRITTLMQNLQAGILVEDESRKIVLTNAEFCKMFGIAALPENLIGMDCTSSAEDFKPLFKDPVKFVNDIETTLRNKTIVRSHELELMDGRLFERDYIPIFKSEIYRGHLWQYRDITERKQTEIKLRRSEEQYRKIVNLASEIIFSISPTGEFVMVNPTAVRVMEYAESELIGMNYLSLVRLDFKEKTSRFYKNQIIKRVGATYFEFPAVSKSGKEIWFGQSVHLLEEDNAVVGLQAVARDITELKKYQDDIKSLKEFYEQILNDLPGQIAVFDRDLKYIFVNPESIRDADLRDWIIGHDDMEYCRRRGMDEAIGRHRQGFLLQAIDSKKPLSFEEKIQYPNGSTGYFFRVVSPVLDRQNRVVRLIGYGVDITERRQAEEERDRFFNLSTDLLCIAGFDGKFKRINPAFELLLNYSSEELLRKQFTEFIHPEDIQSTIDEINSVRNGGTIKDFENRFICRDGSFRWISWQATAFVEGGLLYAVGRDITQRKSFAEELIRAKSAAEESTKAKDRFLAHMSHEIRTPMNAVLGLSHLLLEMQHAVEQKQFLEAIKFSSENLLVIINDILDFSKIEAGKIDYVKEPFLLDELLHQIQQTVTFAKSEKSIDFIIEINPLVPNVLIGDQVRLNQIILNLVSNAVKFTEVGNVTIHCRVWGETQETVNIMFQVSDTGIGISEEHLKRIFERFEQVGDNRTTKMRGTGLGLAIVKGLVENQGGSIVAESTPGKGSVFTILMPFGKPANHSLTPVPYGRLPEDEITPDLVAGLKVLIAEDNLMNQLVVTSMLKLWDITYAIAGDGLEAFTMLRDEDFDLILMDISMPQLDGYEATEKIRAELTGYKKDIYIIALTASAMLESRELVMKSGMNDYLSKPFKPNELLTKLAKARHNIAPTAGSQNRDAAKTENITNLQPLHDLVAGDLATVREMIVLFISQTPDAIARMREFYAAKQWRDLYKAAHRIRPTMGYMGLNDAMEILLSIEKAALEQRALDTIGPALDTLAQMGKQAIIELRPELERLKRL